MLFLILLLAVALWALKVLKFHVTKKRQRLLALAAQVPSDKAALPFIGHAYKFIGGNLWEELQRLSKLAESEGGVIKIWIASSPMFMTTWKRNRKLLNPAFSQHVLDGFLHIFNKQSDLLVQNLQPLAGTGEIDLENLFAENMLETTCLTVLGITQDIKSVVDQKYRNAVDAELKLLVDKMCNSFLYIDFVYQVPSTKKLEDEAIKTMHNMSKRVIDKRRAERNQEKVADISSPRYTAFLDLMLDMAEDGLFTDEQILEELNGLILGGYDTSSKALISVLVLIGTYPEVQEKIYNEITSVLGNSDVVEAGDVRKLVYTEAVIKEALRVSPVVPFVARDVGTEIKLKNYTLPARSGCVVSLWGIHRLPIWGPDRFEFRPERWLDPASLPQSPGAYCAFSIGRRNCIGKAFALMSLKTTLVHLIRKFKITADYSKVKRKFEILMKFVEGQRLSLELREQC
ncbi:cytochrome P450 4c21-like isoform X2 [Choristoneura fumiferana]|uniref:cytochrome P450 4c21-like isoform X2 n=1 Tax=Choristoneura fumiferana TaxID=7141 RepID=UPI003D154980